MTRNNIKNTTLEPMITGFGKRTIGRQNYSAIFCLPHQALTNLGNPKMLEVELVQQQDGKRFLKLSPIAEMKEGTDSK